MWVILCLFKRWNFYSTPQGNKSREYHEAVLPFLASVGPITVERRYIGVKLPILGEINKEAGSPIGLYAILYTFLLYLELLILVYIKSSSCSQEEQLRQVNTRIQAPI